MISQTPRKTVAIIGTGISGLSAALFLHPHRDITVYEKNDYLGGHSRTVDVKTTDGVIPVDTGFIVFNERTYPLLTKLFKQLDVPIAPSDMSFGVSIDNGWLDYGTQRLTHLFAQTTNLWRPDFWRMLYDILRFNLQAKSYLERPPTFTLGDCLDTLHMGPWFRNYFLLAMGSAIWSTPLAEMLKFPAASFIRFFDNHGLLTIANHPQWYTVKGGSREYVRRLTALFQDRIDLNRAVRQVTRTAQGVMVTDLHSHQHVYDDVVFACHANQALALIADPTPAEHHILSAFRYQTNHAVLHGDISVMPKRRAAWASWVYRAERKSHHASQTSLSYWMNNLQPLPTSQPLIVTLNPGHQLNSALVYDQYSFDHPMFDAATIHAQQKMDEIQGKQNLWFCGAYQRYGFHEDGLHSAVAMISKMGIPLPW